MKLDRVKADHPTLAPLLDELASYIHDSVSAGTTGIEPKLAAAKLRRSEAEVLALLMLLEKAGLVEHRYDIVCPVQNAVITSVKDKKDIEQALAEIEDAEEGCPKCEQLHELNDVRIEIVFEPKDDLFGVTSDRAA